MRTTRLRSAWAGASASAIATVAYAMCVSAGELPAGNTAASEEQTNAVKRSLTVKDSVESARVLSFVSDPGDLSAEAIMISPDRTRYLIVLIRGDLARNGNWVEFYWGSTDPASAGRSPRLAKRLLTVDHRRNTLRVNRIVWLDEHDTVAFLWNGGHVPAQVLTLCLSTGELLQRTNHSRSITSFEMSRDGRAVIFTANGPSSDDQSRTMLSRGFAVPDRALLFDIVQGHVDGHAPLWYPEVYVDYAGNGGPLKVELSQRGNIQGTWLHLAPDGLHAIVLAPPQDIPGRWNEFADSYFVSQLTGTTKNPLEPTRLVQYYVVDLQTAAARPLWDAPTAFSASGHLVWSPDSRHILVGPTFLPLDSLSSAGRAGSALALVDTATGKYSEVSASAELRGNDELSPRAWNQNDTIEFDAGPSGQRRTARLQKSSGRWVLVPVKDSPPVHNPGVRIELQEDLNSPPLLTAVDEKTGEQQLLIDLNPWLRTEVTLGRVEIVKWSDADGHTWTGRLYYPVNYDERRRFPLVVQFASNVKTREFSLSGDELISTAFAAQPLANRDIAVLQMGDPDNGAMKSVVATPDEYKMVLRGLNAAIRSLTAAGLVDSTKVGLIGFSRTGGWVEYAITHSPRPYAAAIVADNQNSSYLQYLTLPGAVRAEYERTNGAAPFGIGLQAWIEHAPGFNADKVYTPLRMEVDQHGVFGILQAWELFSQLRQLNKPVELYVIPESTNGEHGLERPAQILASTEGTADWMDFWLNGRADSDPAKSAQYARWRELQRLHNVQRDRRQ